MPAQDLQKIANRLRADVLTMVHHAGSGHVAGPLSSADLFSTLYFSDIVNHAQDTVVLSCGHYCPIQYSALARKGIIPAEELKTFMVAGSRLPGHPERGVTPGIAVSAGPLGQGVSVAVGMALGIKLKQGHLPHAETPRVYCVLSDGEIQEGQVWEAFTFAVRRQLDNLIFILDRNRVQIEHYVSELATYGDVSGRFESFGLHTLTTDGNDIAQLEATLRKAKHVLGVPAMVVMNTIASKGVSFMEGKPEWHDKAPSKEELAQALQELEGSHND